MWLLSLLLALAAAGVFVGLSRWQFEAAESAAPPPRAQTENAVPLTGHLRPGEPVTGAQADQVVWVDGEFLPGTDVLIGSRLRDGEDGYWTVTAFRVDGAEDGRTVPVVRGWSARADVVDPAPAGTVRVTGRLLPPDAPQPAPAPGEDTAGRPLYATLSPAQLVNAWDMPAYAAYVAAFSVTGPSGAEGDAGAEMGAGAAAGGLEPVWVAPQPEERQVVWLNVFYGVEWVLFAGFALFLWWRFVRDDHERELREIELDEQWAAQWRAEELARRREAARQAKQRALQAQERSRTDDHPAS
ncbi:SURF1 family protein [Micrococcus sp.]|uniref:SURF1 family protein n=1 Tax=Micrococcus sp. TaxID=1271 RepID=UPI002A90D1DF|nr:SURF1 family protein [Micrococcus sp.]MDY6055818.1 SURF1 family protein [Micrococcus sp.]